MGTGMLSAGIALFQNRQSFYVGLPLSIRRAHECTAMIARNCYFDRNEGMP
jgi:hypothetical protein